MQRIHRREINIYRATQKTIGMKKGLKGCFGCLGIIFGVLVLLFAGLYIYSKWIWEEWPPARIERITGVRVPKYKVIKCDQGERHFTGDYMDTITIEFETVPSDELFDDIDKMIATGNTKWEKEGDKYSFSTFWRNGHPAPKGESEGADTIFKITITKGEKKGEIISGAW